jgi:hypothetical protein
MRAYVDPRRARAQVAAGRDAPVMQTSLVSRQSDAELRMLDAVREAMRATLAEALPHAGIVVAAP